MGGGASTYDYGFRIYNAALAKFLSVDPLSASYPWYTPYQFAGNMPIWAIDLDGCEPVISQESINNSIGQPTLKLQNGKTAIISQGYYIISYHTLGADPNNGSYYYCRIGGKEWIQFQPLSMSNMHYQYIKKHFQGIGKSMDIMLVGAVVGVGSILTLGAAIEIFGTQAVATWLAEEAVETVFENITGIPAIVNPMDVLQKGVGKLFKGSLKKLKSFERQRAAEYMSQGKFVERIDEAPNVEPRCDFIIDGKYTEFKALDNLEYNASTALTKLQDATMKTNVQVIDLDIRKPGGTPQNARDLYARFLGTTEGKAFQGEVRIATSDGLLTFKK